MFSHILTPLDGSPLACCILPHVVAMARATRARITLLRVLERHSMGLTGDVNPFDWHMQKLEAQTYLEEMAAQLLRSVDVPVTVELLEGCAAVQIIDYAQRTDADLIVLSSHGEGGLSDWHTSSVAQKVIQRIGISVLLVRAWRLESSCEPAQWGEQRYHRILAPLDGSKRAECALPIAAALAADADALWLVHVVPRPELFQRLPLTAEEEALLEQIGKRNQQQAEHYFEQVQARLPSCRTSILANHNVATTLHRFIADEQIDLVLLCAHGFSGQAQWAFGSLVQNFINYGDTPLLIVQDMPAHTSGAVQTAAQSAAQQTRTALCAPQTEHLRASQSVSNRVLFSATSEPRAARTYAHAF